MCVVFLRFDPDFPVLIVMVFSETLIMNSFAENRDFLIRFFCVVVI